MFRTIGDQPSLWESLLPEEEVLRLPEELAWVDALLDDPGFFAPFVPFFSLVAGRPSTPVECYLRMMFLKFRYRLGFESLCAEVSDSITWRRFCRIPLDGRVPHPTTLMKLTTRCGTTAVDGLNEALLAKAAGAKLLRTSRLRADTTVVPANVCYPADSGLLAKAVRRIAVTGRRIQAAGGGRRTRVRDRSRSAGKRAHAIAAKLGLRGAQRREEAQATVARVTGELAGLAERAAHDARRLLANARRALRRAQARAAALAAADGFAVRSVTWPDCWGRPSGSPRRPGSGSPGSPRQAPPGGSACTTPTPGRSPRAASASRTSSATRPRSPTTTTASCPATPWSRATRPTPPQLAPAIERVIKRTGRRPRTVTADRGYGEKSVDDALHEMGGRNVVIPRKGRPGKDRQAAGHRPAFRRTVKWRTGSEGRISTLKRGYSWDRTRLDGTEGARIWTGHGILAHNLVKIAVLTS